MNIDELLALSALHKQQPEHAVIIDKQWSQGRTVYGGISAALLYSAAKSHISDDRVMRSMSTNFVGPLLSEHPFTITVEIVREGKNVSQLQARAIQNHKTCVISQVCFGQSRDSNVIVVNNDKHAMQVPRKGNFIPQIPKITPKFLKHFDLSIQEGGVPFLGGKNATYHGWMRYKKAPLSFSDAHLVGIIDAWPPTLLQMLKGPSPTSTVSWNLEFIHPHRPILGTDWLAYQAHTRQAAAGYGHTEANIWDATGELIAISRQTVAVFD